VVPKGSDSTRRGPTSRVTDLSDPARAGLEQADQQDLLLGDSGRSLSRKAAVRSEAPRRWPYSVTGHGRRSVDIAR